MYRNAANNGANSPSMAECRIHLLTFSFNTSFLTIMSSKRNRKEDLFQVEWGATLARSANRKAHAHLGKVQDVQCDGC